MLQRGKINSPSLRNPSLAGAGEGGRRLDVGCQGKIILEREDGRGEEQNYSFTKVRMTSSRIRLRSALPELRIEGGGRYRRFSGRGRLRDERTENPTSAARSVTHFEFLMKVSRKLQLPMT